jgi:DNA (cytosine-5)-methyltransferase 1
LNHKTDNIKLLVIDLFCGAGGVTTGFEQSGVAKVVICVNHDPQAIEAHKLNHPEAVHFVEDVRKVNIRNFLPIIDTWKVRYPNAKVLLWASVECTNHSIAKGGLPKDADSRTLAVPLYPYIKILEPDYVGIENVKEFRDWSPLVPKIKYEGMTVKNEKSIYKIFESNEYAHLEGACCPLVNGLQPWLIPDPLRKGELFRRFINVIKSMGFNYADANLNAADFGAFTNRLRYFGIFARHGLGIQLPRPTHGKGLIPHKAVRDVLQLDKIGNSIFHGRKKPHCDKTLTRILRGLEKFATPSYVMTCTSPGYMHSIEQPCGTLTTACHKALVTVKG